MAQRRMFSKKITDTDVFLEMPATAQNLYFHLNMHADDDGFLGNAKTIQRMIGANEDDLKLLVAKSFLIIFPDGVTVIRDWRVHNYIRSDRHRPTIYSEHKKQLMLDENQRYQLNGGFKQVGMTDGRQDVIPNGYTGKDRLGKDSLNTYSASDDALCVQNLQDSFEKIWKGYPNKKGKKEAFNHYKAWRKKSSKNTDEYLLKKLKEYLDYCRNNSSWYHPMNGSTWFNGRFDDELDNKNGSNSQTAHQGKDWFAGFNRE
ncbi:hypothetical protein [Limosilactobacillus oris]|uniref:hypothetical protein n=1 Tax=Limosilactobacillus oris TaxID=1632 RepID=UPI0032099428